MDMTGAMSGPPPDVEDEEAEAVAGRHQPGPDAHTGLPPSAPSGIPEPRGLAALGDRFPAADGARAVAALGVVLTHVGILSGFNFRHPGIGAYFARADVGVSVFFVLSGFLLYRPFLVRRFARQPQGEVGRYARRRILRIFPAYWFALTIVGFVLEAPGFGGQSVVAKYLLLQIYDPSQVVAGPIDQAWSLATEISFYLFLPIWAWFMARGDAAPDRQLRREILGLAGLWLGCVALNLAVIGAGVEDARFGMYGTWLPFRIHEFVFGMALAVGSAWLSHRGLALPRRWSGTPFTLVCWAGAAVAFWAAATQMGFPTTLEFSPGQAFGIRLVYSVIGLLFIAPVVLGRQDRGLTLRLLANPVLVWLGLISYGIYIWHKAVQYEWLEWTGQEALSAGFLPMLVVTVAVSIVAAACSWYLIEKPLMKRRDRIAGAAL